MTVSNERGRQRKRKRNQQRIALLILLVLIIVGAVFIGGKLTAAVKSPAENPKSNIEDGTLKSQGQEPEPKAPKNPFEELYYYEPGCEDRYEAYQASHPELSAEEVVWRVDACLDRPFYTEIQEIGDVSASPLVPNKYYKLPDDFVPQNLVSLPSGRKVTAATKEAYDQLRAAAGADGYRIEEGSAYRSIDYQKEVYARYLKKDSQAEVDTYSSRPGHSDHHTGEAIDLLGPGGSLTAFEGTKEAAWVAENAWKYGFVIRFPQGMDEITGYRYEPWHIRYVGVEIAEKMREEKVSTLEEYKVKYLDHKPSH